MKNAESPDPHPRRVLVLVFDGVEEVEALAPVDVLRRAQLAVTLASVNENPIIEGRNGIRFLADCSLASLDSAAYDLIFLPGGPGALELLEDEAILKLIRSQEKSGKWLAAICAAPKVLAAAGVLEDRMATGHSSIRSDLPQPSDERIVISNRIITSQGAGTAIEFGLELAALLTNPENARAIAASIHA